MSFELLDNLIDVHAFQQWTPYTRIVNVHSEPPTLAGELGSRKGSQRLWDVRPPHPQ